MKKRIISLALALVVALSLLPGAVLAATGERKPSEMFACLPANPAPVTPPTYEEAVNEWDSGYEELWPEEYRDMGSKAVYTEIVSLVNSLTKGKTSETAKAKAIYQWVANNSSPEQLVVPEGVTVMGQANIPQSVTSIILPSTLKKIGGLSRHENLTSISIPEGVTRIGATAFAGCTNLTSVVITGATEIGDQAFSWCENLKSVTLPDSLKKLGNFVFEDCKSLSSVEIPAGVTEIGNNVFIGCTSLTSVTLPAGLTKIGAGTFYGCSSLKDVWFCGTKEQWDAIEEIDSKGNDALKKATVHYNSVHSTGTAYASNITVDVDGKPVEFQCYALHDANGNPTNYIKLRDLADILNGTAAQFEVGFDGSALITTKRAYTPNGSEHSTPFSGNRTYRLAGNSTKIDGRATDLAAFMLYDDNGGGYTYYQLRDLGEKLGFNVGWSGDRGAFVETGKPYNPND